jgi:hypothetical protein
MVKYPLKLKKGSGEHGEKSSLTRGRRAEVTPFHSSGREKTMINGTVMNQQWVPIS